MDQCSGVREPLSSGRRAVDESFATFERVAGLII
jgi:hypothetical protein